VKQWGYLWEALVSGLDMVSAWDTGMNQVHFGFRLLIGLLFLWVEVLVDYPNAAPPGQHNSKAALLKSWRPEKFEGGCVVTDFQT